MENLFDSLSGDRQFNKNYSIRVKQFAAFATFSGFDKMLENAWWETVMEAERSNKKTVAHCATVFGLWLKIEKSLDSVGS